VQRKSKRLQQGPKSMSTLHRSRVCSLSALLLCVVALSLLAQSTMPQAPHCLSIHVRLNGKPVDGPQVITLTTKQNENTASLEGGCFRVPPALLTEKVLDVSFTIPGNKIHLSSIATGFFAGPWNLNLEDKKFGKEVGLPKHARAREACAVVFHVGEPERELVQTGCRTPLSSR
jgi:hypothetical protein